MTSDEMEYQIPYYHSHFWRSPAAEYLRERGLQHSTIERFSFGYVPGGYYAGHLVIPYQTGMYAWRGFRLRRLEGDKGPKYVSPQGFKAHLFAPRAADEAVVVIAEGELDAATLWQLGVKACAVPGANTWQEPWAWLFRDCREVLVCFDGDEAGSKGARKVEHSLTRRGVNARVVQMPDGEDINSLYVNAGASRVREVLGV